MGPIDCPEMLVRNYYSALNNISEECNLILCYGDAGLGFALHGLVQRNPFWRLVWCASYVNIISHI
jgi:hypothetical protein